MSRGRYYLILAVVMGLWHGLPAREDTARPVPSSSTTLRINSAEGMAVLPGGVAAEPGFGPATAPGLALLRDGFTLAGVDGKLIGSDSNDVWYFELKEDVNDYRVVARAGTRLEMLPSSTLEKMIADAKTRSTPAYRLWNAEITKYRDRNFIFPRYFLPLREATEDGGRETMDDGRSDPRPSVLEPQIPDSNTSEIEIDEPNDVLTVPPEIMERFKNRRQRPTTTSLRQIMDSNEIPAAQVYTRGADSVFVDRMAFLVEQADGGLAFVPDALGRSVQKLSLQLLPCEVLELTEREQSAELEPLRFKIAGILTKYKGEQYLLLQKATRTYSHGNFGR
ncbi:MAG: hypothetical protein A2Z25_16085 [Planctomycetes bacterium RBG_16_55_9]|nr:MAG: hypothetical protein A2Z25_16085 [Planctomycetes bacterium RBG_16_55_9]